MLMNSEGQNIFSGTSRAMPSALTVCNGQPHSVVFTIGNSFVTLQIDGFAAETIPFGAFQYSAPLSVPIYLGGIKGRLINYIYSVLFYIHTYIRCHLQ